MQHIGTTHRMDFLTVVSAQRTPGGYYYAANNFAAAEHGGTHLDAPVHFVEGRHTTDQIPIDQLMGPAVVIDVSHQVHSSPHYPVSPAEFERLEVAHRRIPLRAIGLVQT